MAKVFLFQQSHKLNTRGPPSQALVLDTKAKSGLSVDLASIMGDAALANSVSRAVHSELSLASPLTPVYMRKKD